MFSQTSQRTRMIVTIVIGIAAIVIIIAEPLLMQQIVPEMLANQKARGAGFPPSLIKITFPLWMAFGVLGGIVVLAVARDFYEGKLWARGLSLFALAMPSMAGAYMVGPLVVFGCETFVHAIVISLLGLIPYFTILFAEKLDRAQKSVNLIVFTLLGVQGAHSFEMGHGSLKHQFVDAYGPTWGVHLFKTWFGNHVVWLGTLCLILAILFLGMWKKAGWYLAVVGGAATMIGNYWPHIAAPGPTNDYLVGGTLGLLIVVLMFIPAVKQRLYDERTPV
jgi:hypothetical protein